MLQNNNIPLEKQAIQLISQVLFQAEIQIHILHLQATDKKYSTHKALEKFYKDIGDINDRLVESSYIKVGILNKYSNMTIGNGVDAVSFLRSALEKIENMRKHINSGYIQQITDDVIELFASTIYKLDNLK